MSLGCTDQDAILAPGVVPVANREFTGNQPPATWPWAQPGLARRTPTVPPVSDVSTESVAAPGPDLIAGISAGRAQEQYGIYSTIAPMVAAPPGFVDHRTPWQDATRLTGQALGRSTEAEKPVADLEARLARARQQYPALAGAAGVLPRGARPDDRPPGSTCSPATGSPPGSAPNSWARSTRPTSSS
ncbi:ABC transporter substrate-binding protein [Pseudonocardia benzenivorans]|uniref:ABC transporter substrate-binding protein n=1 Tax=Pseudonocardia benzenivorans TaxID=228005 RepID=A0ABW3VTT9_9PSEU